MSQIQEPPLQRPFTIEVGGQTLIDPIWGKWLFDLAQYINALNGSTSGSLTLSGGITTGLTTFLHSTSAALANGAGAAAGTLLNAPAAGNPTKWIAINDNGTTRRIPTW